MPLFTPGTTSYDRVALLDLASKEGVGVDLHFHTRYSDGNATVERAVERARRLGIGLAITDHNEVRGSLEAARIAEGKVFILPAIEVNCAEGCDLLVYFATHKDLVRFYEAEVAPYRGLNPAGKISRGLVQVAEGAIAHGGTVSAAHPLGVLGRKNLHKFTDKHGTEVLEMVHAMESNNGATAKKTNERALGWARKLGKASTGGSDAHTLYETGQVVTWSQATTPGTFLEALRANETAVRGKKLGPIGRVGPASMVVRRHLPYFVPGVRALMHRIDPRAILARTAVALTHPEYATVIAD